MDLRDLATALHRHDALGARAWVAESVRQDFDWPSAPRPEGLDRIALAIAAGMAELLATRAGKQPPSWTADVAGLSEPFSLVRAAAVMPRLRRLCETEGPEPLRSRGLLAPPEFLTAA